jgi:hypothetical protein
MRNYLWLLPAVLIFAGLAYPDRTPEGQSQEVIAVSVGGDCANGTVVNPAVAPDPVTVGPDDEVLWELDARNAVGITIEPKTDAWPFQAFGHGGRGQGAVRSGPRLPAIPARADRETPGRALQVGERIPYNVTITCQLGEQEPYDFTIDPEIIIGDE